MFPFLCFPIILGANSSEVIPLPLALKTTIKSSPETLVFTGLQPRPKFTSVNEPNRNDFTSTSVCGWNPSSAAIFTSMVRVDGVISFSFKMDNSIPLFKGTLMFLELCLSLGRSFHFIVSITAKFIWTARPFSSWKTLGRSYLNQRSTVPSLWNDTPGMYASPCSVTQCTPSLERW